MTNKIIRCPYCQSSNVKKSTTGQITNALSTAVGYGIGYGVTHL